MTAMKKGVTILDIYTLLVISYRVLLKASSHCAFFSAGKGMSFPSHRSEDQMPGMQATMQIQNPTPIT